MEIFCGTLTKIRFFGNKSKAIKITTVRILTITLKLSTLQQKALIFVIIYEKWFLGNNSKMIDITAKRRFFVISYENALLWP